VAALGILLALVVAGWWLSRLTVTPHVIGEMPNRVALPRLHLHDPSSAIAKLAEPDEIVIPHERAIVVIKYPLSIPASIEVHATDDHGFTRAELVKAICDSYAQVYETEAATATNKPVLALEERTGARRNRTDGLYGIWGYDLSDLVLTATHWTRRFDGIVVIDLQVVT
jgi:hypothetical protein